MTYAFFLQESPADRSLLTIFSQAGGFQWPLLGVLLAGLLVLAIRFVQSFFDRRAARILRGLPIQNAQVKDLSQALAGCDDSLHARILTGMLELWHAGAPAVAIGQEVRALIDTARAAYTRTERVVSFLSSTAGGLGLLGTLTGIYLLFSAGTRDAETIFAGIAVAVVSTLLGIVVTIVLELLESLLHAWTSRYVEAADEWGARIRYRLIALTTPTKNRETATCEDH